MSRTYRKQNVNAPLYVTHDWLTPDNYSCGIYTEKTKTEHAKELAMYHSDGSTWSGERPGTHFCNFYQRKSRRREFRLLKQYFLNEDVDLNIRNKPRLPYWN